jgi:hypothetical protein
MKKSVGNRKIMMSDCRIITSNPPASFPLKIIRAGEYADGRKIGIERVKDQEKRREQENHNVGQGPT